MLTPYENKRLSFKLSNPLLRTGSIETRLLNWQCGQVGLGWISFL